MSDLPTRKEVEEARFIAIDARITLENIADAYISSELVRKPSEEEIEKVIEDWNFWTTSSKEVTILAKAIIKLLEGQHEMDKK